jgi:alkylation response protein AidB-like acyl-CoA dehydrogenase
MDTDTGSTAELDDLRAMVRGLVAKELALADLRVLDPAAARLAGWRSLAETGLLGIAVPERFGGSGAGPVEQAIVCEELARELAPTPYFATACLAAGDRTATFTVSRGTAHRNGDGWRVDAQLRHVPDGVDADLLLLIADTADGATLFAVTEPDTVHRERLQTLDATRPLAHVRLAAAPARAVGTPGDGDRIASEVRLRATALLAAEQAAIAEQCVELTRRYLLDRRQFGRPIGAFQALKHRLADAAVRAELASSSAWYAIRCLAAANAADAAGFAAGVAAAHCRTPPR